MIRSIEQTCSACPSQWEGVLEDGRHLYVRYRWGRLSIVLTQDGVEARHNFFVGDDMDGVITWEEVVPYFDKVVRPVEL